MPAEEERGSLLDARRRTWRESLSVYLERRQLAIFLMGFSSGLPLLLGFGTLSYWLRQEGISLTAIGIFALVSLPYSVKFAWAPLLDHLRLPVLTPLLGRRRGWILFIQVLLMIAIVALGASDPTAAPAYMATMAVVMTFLSASQDIVVDAYRIDVLRPEEQGAGAAATQAGYRVGLLAGGAGALALSDYVSWFVVYSIMAALVTIGMLGVALGPEPAAPQRPETLGRGSTRERIAGWLRYAVIDPLADFTTRRGWVAILAFVLLYKYGDAVAGIMANPFYVDMGYSGTEIAEIAKGLGIAMALVGALVGGLLVARLGVWTALVVGGVLQAATNLIYAWLATQGHDLIGLTIAVGADNFTGGLGSAAFVAYLSGLCNRAFTGTQYALLTSLMAFGRTALSSGGGVMADQLGWVWFFVATTLIAVPGLLLLLWLRRLYPTADAPARDAAPAQ